MPETTTNSLTLNNLTVDELTKKINYLIKNKKERRDLQKLSIKNFYLTHRFVSSKIDSYREKKLSNLGFFYNRKINKPMRILHITNFNERLDGRLFF